jgi:hypothetical protein
VGYDRPCGVQDCHRFDYIRAQKDATCKNNDQTKEEGAVMKSNQEGQDEKAQWYQKNEEQGRTAQKHA